MQLILLVLLNAGIPIFLTLPIPTSGGLTKTTPLEISTALSTHEIPPNRFHTVSVQKTAFSLAQH